MDNPYNNIDNKIDLQSKNYTSEETSVIGLKRNSMSISKETLERNERFSYQKLLEQRSNRVK